MSTNNTSATTPATTDRAGTPPRRRVPADDNPLRTTITSAATARRVLGVRDARPATGTATAAVDTGHSNDTTAVGVRGA